MAVVSAVKLDAHGPAANGREAVEEQREQQACTPAPPAPKVVGTDPSVQTVTSAGGRVSRRE